MFKNVYVIGAKGVMGQLLSRRIRTFMPKLNVIDFDKGDELLFGEGPNLVVISTPISTIKGIIEDIAKLKPSQTFVVELGSVKGQFNEYVTAAEGLAGFDSAHTMTGPLATDWDVFDWKKNCIFINNKAPNKEVIDFWKDLGFVIKAIDYKSHDIVIGKLSHLSHFMIMTYVDFIKETLTADEIALAGTSFEKFSAMAVGARRLNDIYTANDFLPNITADFSVYMQNKTGKFRSDT